MMVLEQAAVGLAKTVLGVIKDMFMRRRGVGHLWYAFINKPFVGNVFGHDDFDAETITTNG